MTGEKPSRRNAPSAQRRRKKIAFGWYGGKFSHLDFLLPNLPDDATHFAMYLAVPLLCLSTGYQRRLKPTTTLIPNLSTFSLHSGTPSAANAS